jgi:hypothetical protein
MQNDDKNYHDYGYFSDCEMINMKLSIECVRSRGVVATFGKVAPIRSLEEFFKCKRNNTGGPSMHKVIVFINLHNPWTVHASHIQFSGLRTGGAVAFPCPPGDGIGTRSVFDEEAIFFVAYQGLD